MNENLRKHENYKKIELYVFLIETRSNPSLLITNYCKNVKKINEFMLKYVYNIKVIFIPAIYSTSVKI